MFRFFTKQRNTLASSKKKVSNCIQKNTRTIKSCIDNIHMHILAVSNSMDDYLITANNSNKAMSVEDQLVCLERPIGSEEKIDKFHNLINNTIDMMILYSIQDRYVDVDLNRTVYNLFNHAIRFKIDKIDINLLNDKEKMQIVHIANVMRAICKDKIINIRIYVEIKEIKNDSPFLELNEVYSAYEYIKSAISIARKYCMYNINLWIK